MTDTFPILLKEGKFFNALSHSAPKLRMTAIGLREVKRQDGD
jgi:hypothetical protein